MLLLAIFSNLWLVAAAWTAAPGSSYCVTPVRTNKMARSLITTATLASTSLFAKAEDSPLLQRQQGDRPRRWRLMAGEDIVSGGGNGFRWTPLKIIQATAIFVLAGIAEIGGGWLVWKAVRENKPWWWAVVGSLVMVLYAFLPTLQPTDSFGRIYAVYGGYFIGLSYIWGWLFDGMKPDTGDVVGGCLALLAVLIIQYWPRQQ